jgi:hypothetical protein
MLLFGAAVLITFLKLVFFAFFIALFGGAAFLIFRLFGGRRKWRQYQAEYAPYRNFDGVESLNGRPRPYADPIRPNYRTPFSDNPFTRKIEVQ